jgi:L-lactate dehydrogenase complex protein LldG
VSSARDEILARLESANPPHASQPDDMSPPPRHDHPVAQLSERVHEAGGRCQSVARADWLSQVEWPIALPATEHLYSAIPGLASRGVGQSAASDRELDGLDLCVLRAEFGVVENGALWHVPSRPRDRVAALLATHLIMVVDESSLVDTLHQAYAQIDLTQSAFGWFLCGPSKTADIEQSLVLGAHGPKTMGLVVIGA